MSISYQTSCGREKRALMKTDTSQSSFLTWFPEESCIKRDKLVVNPAKGGTLPIECLGGIGKFPCL